jgi:hypothetical protein
MGHEIIFISLGVPSIYFLLFALNNTITTTQPIPIKRIDIQYNKIIDLKRIQN